mmetsp:Transcript_4306/g.6190  ORF Transcript_4306/g.6190 Transcript_4306/m.6190 type:complete len:80 (-) Transcript_4306:341-580(-)
MEDGKSASDNEGVIVRSSVAMIDGTCDREKVVITIGEKFGIPGGIKDGRFEGKFVGDSEGAVDGSTEGLIEGKTDGETD